ncbi:MAG TPA: hypothetical protein VI588_04395, partial [Candidatus Gracilibacteria bacterium]|nr:hypothetical protein [Candidatus Gracilibacteria bacterium]
YDQIAKNGSVDESVRAELQKKIETLKNDILNKALESPRGIHFEDMDKLYQLFDTDTRTTAIVLQMLSRVEPEHPYVPKILRHLLMEKKDGRYASTQETAASLLALVEYLTNSGELEADYDGIITLNGAEKLNKSYSLKNIADQDVLNFALSELNQNNQDNELAFVRNGAGKMYADINLKYYLPTEKIEPRDEGIVVTHEYFMTDDAKMEKPVKTIKVGENLKAKVTVVVPENRYYVMVEDYLPAGLEGVDFSLATSQQGLQDGKGSSYGEGYYGGGYYGGWYFNYSEIRDDRMMYFADFLPKGVYEIEYFVRATTPGTFHDLPVLAQELYFPEVFGRSAGNIFEVTE